MKVMTQNAIKIVYFFDVYFHLYVNIANYQKIEVSEGMKRICIVILKYGPFYQEILS